MTGQAVWLISGLLFGHFLGDFTPLATDRMQHAKANGGPLLPIFAHAAVHTLLAGTVIVLAAGPAWRIVAIAAAIELTTHFIIDAGRARLGLRFASLRSPSENAFWYALGADQLSHALILVGLAAYVL